MPDNPYKIGDKVWWVGIDFNPVLATIKHVSEMDCLIHVPEDRIFRYIRYKKLFKSEKMALVDAQVQLQILITEWRDKLDALFEKRNAIRQRLNLEPSGSNTHG